MKSKLKILHLEDSPEDAEMIESELIKGNILFDKLVVDNKEDFKKALKDFFPDIILSDHSLPSFNSIEALKIVRQMSIDIPFILITATVSEEFAVSTIQNGATDYILKAQMGRLPSAILQAIDNYHNRIDKLKAEAELQAAHERLLFHLGNSPMGYIEWDEGNELKNWSKRAEEIFGWTKTEFAENRKTGYSHIYVEDREWVAKLVEQLLDGIVTSNNAQCRCYTKDGRIIWCEWFNSVLKNKEGKVITVMSLVQDITERKRSEQALINNEFRFREFFETAPEALFVLDANTRLFIDNNDNALKLLKCTKEQLFKMFPEQISPPFQPDGQKSIEKINEFIRQTMLGQKPVFEWVIIDAEGKEIFCEVRLNLLTNANLPLIRASVLDVTDRILLEKGLAEEKLKKQQEITEAVITSQEQQRSFLGEELHDNINQILATSKLYLDYSIKAKDVRKDIMTISRNHLVSAMEEIRKLSKSLLPPLLGKVSLQDAINDIIETIEQVNKLKFIKEWDGLNEALLSEKLKLTIFRIFQEQLNNVLKYAKAKTVIIGFEQQPGMIKLTIKDDGVGFDTTTKRNGAGFQNILSRVNFFKGKIAINSMPGEGCELTVTLNIEGLNE